jgi:hypothetical protein
MMFPAGAWEDRRSRIRDKEPSCQRSISFSWQTVLIRF